MTIIGSAPAVFIVPTVAARRPRLEAFLAAYDDTAEASQLLIAVDTEDHGTWDGLKLPHGAHMAAAPRMDLGPKVNHWAMRHAGDWDHVGFLADDCIPETPGWDLMLLEALDGRPGIAYPQSGRNALPEHWLMSSSVLRALGWAFQPGLKHYYADVVLSEIGSMAGCLYPAGCMVRHEHHDRAAVEHDQTYRQAELAHGGPDGEAYALWRARDRMHDVMRVRAVVDAAAYWAEANP